MDSPKGTQVMIIDIYQGTETITIDFIPFPVSVRGESGITTVGNQSEDPRIGGNDFILGQLDGETIDLTLVMIADMKSSLKSLEKKVEVVDKRLEAYLYSAAQSNQQMKEIGVDCYGDAAQFQQQCVKKAIKIKVAKVFDKMLEPRKLGVVSDLNFLESRILRDEIKARMFDPGIYVREMIETSMIPVEMSSRESTVEYVPKSLNSKVISLYPTILAPLIIDDIEFVKWLLEEMMKFGLDGVLERMLSNLEWVIRLFDPGKFSDYVQLGLDGFIDRVQHMRRLHKSPKKVRKEFRIDKSVKSDGAALCYGVKCWLPGATPTKAQLKNIDEWLVSNLGDAKRLSADCLADYGYLAAALLGDDICGMAATKIAIQDDVNEAYGAQDDFQHILKPYQLSGVNFLMLLHRKKIHGAILVDEMRLGKNVHIITHQTTLKHWEDDIGSHLILCSDFILENWESKRIYLLKISGEDASSLIASTEENRHLTMEKEVEVQNALFELQSKFIENLVQDSVLVNNDEESNDIMRPRGEKKMELKLKSRVDLVEPLVVADLKNVAFASSDGYNSLELRKNFGNGLSDFIDDTELLFEPSLFMLAVTKAFESDIDGVANRPQRWQLVAEAPVANEKEYRARKTNVAKIKVVVRKRQLNKESARKEEDIVDVYDDSHLTVYEPKLLVDLTAYVEKHEFYFDVVLNEQVTNGEISSGKAYTMQPLPLRAAEYLVES